QLKEEHLHGYSIIQEEGNKELARVRGRFVEKVSKALIKQLLDDLLEDRLLNDGETDSVLEDNTGKADMARCLIDMVRRKGDKASRKMIEHLENRDPTLYSELGLTCKPAPVPAPQNQQAWSNSLVTTTDSFWNEKRKSKDVYAVSDVSLRSRVALLITNRNFANPSLTRKGAEKDEENMEKLLRSLGYEVVKHNDLTAQRMNEVLCTFTEHPKLRDTDSVFVVIMSHGKREFVLGVNHSEEKPDEFPVDNIYKHLGPQECPALMNKPKIIIIQACRGGEGGSVVVSDSASAKVVSDDVSQQLPANAGGNIVDDAIRHVHKEKDFISLLSSTPDTVSYRREDLGSFLIQYIAEVFNTCSHEDDIDELFRKVMQRFEEFPDDTKRQMPTKDRCTLTKRFYLFPGH
uniref:Caspase-1-like n=1 Tax=Poecilia latipinna TaxID=48699 RepID=A0A3B3VE98_9TELE